MGPCDRPYGRFTSGFGLAFIRSPRGTSVMSQSTLDDDELFGEAASEMREDVESSLAAARAALALLEIAARFDG